MDKNLSWTSSLGDAYANQQQDVTDAVQTMRQQARMAGHLRSNEQEKLTTQGSTVIIEPANPDVVYVPAYDPWLVYGDPIVAYPGWYPVPSQSASETLVFVVITCNHSAESRKVVGLFGSICIVCGGACHVNVNADEGQSHRTIGQAIRKCRYNGCGNAK